MSFNFSPGEQKELLRFRDLYRRETERNNFTPSDSKKQIENLRKALEKTEAAIEQLDLSLKTAYQLEFEDDPYYPSDPLTMIGNQINRMKQNGYELDTSSIPRRNRNYPINRLLLRISNLYKTSRDRDPAIVTWGLDSRSESKSEFARYLRAAFEFMGIRHTNPIRQFQEIQANKKKTLKKDRLS